MSNIKCVEVVVKEKPAPPEEKPPEEKPSEGKIPWEYIGLGALAGALALGLTVAGVSIPIVGITALKERS